MKEASKTRLIMRKLQWYLKRTQPIGGTVTRTGHFMNEKVVLIPERMKKQMCKAVLWVKQMIEQVVGTSKTQSNVN
jgi:hypothetical protein